MVFVVLHWGERRRDERPAGSILASRKGLQHLPVRQVDSKMLLRL
jgi:hypothetical protein